MIGKFKIIGALLAMLGVLSIPETSFAGWGAIACSQNNDNCGVSYGWPNLAAAKSYALIECLKSNKSCHIWQWEHNMCIRGPYGAYTCK
jgi:Domain of unknown function (DUF4189)